METWNYVPRGSGARLVVLEGDRIRIVELDGQKKWLLGRASSGTAPDIVLHSRIASRQHGWLMGVDEDWFYVDNPRNLNGTALNGTRIPQPLSGTRKPVSLKNGDVLRIDCLEGEAVDRESVVMVYTTEKVKGNWAVLPLYAGYPVTIGRDRDCNLVLENDQVSGKHGRLEAFNGRFYLTDCGSKTGIVLNGKKIEEPTLLRRQDHFSICGSHYFFLGDRLLFER